MGVAADFFVAGAGFLAAAGAVAVVVAGAVVVLAETLVIAAGDAAAGAAGPGAAPLLMVCAAALAADAAVGAGVAAAGAACGQGAALGAAGAGFFLWPKIELRLEIAFVALETLELAAPAAFCAAAEPVALATDVAVPAIPLAAHPGWAAPAAAGWLEAAPPEEFIAVIGTPAVPPEAPLEDAPFDKPLKIRGNSPPRVC